MGYESGGILRSAGGLKVKCSNKRNACAATQDATPRLSKQESRFVTHGSAEYIRGDILVSAGTEPERVSSQGYSATWPLADAAVKPIWKIA